MNLQKKNGWKWTTLIGLLSISILVTSGCQVSSSAMRAKPGASSGVSDEEYKKIKESIKLNTISVASNAAGFMVFYGEVTNDSDRLIRKAEIVVVSTEEQKKGQVHAAGVIGRGTVENLESGDTQTFNIVSTMESTDFSGYEVRLEKIEF